MAVTVSNLGWVKSVYSGVTPPSNLKMVWYDENVGYHKFYNESTSSWVKMSNVEFYETYNEFPVTGEDGVLYVDKGGKTTYIYDITYVSVGGGSTLMLGETETTAYRGDRGKTAYDHSQSVHAPVNAQENVIESISVNGSQQQITNKNVDISIPTGGGVGTGNVYLSATDSDVSGYDTLSYGVDVAQTVYSQTVNNNELLVKTFLFGLGIDVTVLNTGIVPIKVWGKVDVLSSGCYVRCEGFVRNTSNVETTLFTQTSDVLSTSYSEINIDHVITSLLNVNSTDRFGLRVYVGKTQESNSTISIAVGNGTASYISLPIPATHPILRRKNQELNYQHIDQTSTKTTLVDADSVALWDSVALKFLITSITNLRSFLKTYFDTIYTSLVTTLPTSDGYVGKSTQYKYGATLAFGQIAYSTLVSSESVAKLSANTSSDTCKAMFVVATAGVNGDVKNMILPGSFIYDSSKTFTDGLPVYIDGSGNPTTTPPAVGSGLYAQVVGRAVGIHCWYFLPSGSQIGLV